MRLPLHPVPVAPTRGRLLTLVHVPLARSGSGIFKSENPEALARAVVLATTHYQDPFKLAEVSEGLGEGMKGENKLGAAAGKEMTADRGY